MNTIIIYLQQIHRVYFKKQKELSLVKIELELQIWVKKKLRKCMRMDLRKASYEFIIINFVIH